MLSQNEIWEGIVQKWATSVEILAFLDVYVESRFYELLSNHEQLEFDTFRRIIEDALDKNGTSRLLYNYLEYRLGNYGWQLED